MKRFKRVRRVLAPALSRTSSGPGLGRRTALRDNHFATFAGNAGGEAVGCELLPPADLYLAEPATRHARWSLAAMDAVVAPPDAEVQGLVGSPGWVVFGSDNGEPIAVDLTPGPRGHLGQIIFIGYDEHTGADLIADSLTDMVLNGPDEEPRRHRRDAEPPVVAHVNHHAIVSVEAAAHPGLEVLSLGFRDGEPFGLAPSSGCPA